MRSVVVAASLLASSLLMTSPSAAQDPAPPPPPAAQERTAGARRSPDAARVRETERASDSNRAPEGAVRRPARETTAEAAPPARVESGGAVRRAPPTPTPAPAVTNASATAATASSDDDQRPGAVRRPSGDRDGGGRTVDRAIPRSQAPPPPHTVVRNYPYYHYPNYARYYDPWGYGSFGLGYFYYSPWAWNASYSYGYGGGYGYGYGYPYPAYGGPWGYDIGAVKIKMQPRDAEVWVDGYYAGVVDDFDGAFQALRLDSGPYRIEIRKPGFETRAFDVRVQPNRTITFRGDLRPTP